MKILNLLLVSGMFMHPLFAVEDSTAYYLSRYNHFLDSIENNLQYDYGAIQLVEDIATLEVPEGYKFLNAKQSDFVLTELWGNPPSEVLGLLFPDSSGPLSENFTYAVEVTYSEEGFIEDEDVNNLDFNTLMEEMQEDTKKANQERLKQGYPPIDLLGWASEPYYDEDTKKLHWAKALKFGDDSENTLNYNIRVLGRNGYLNLNAIGSMDVLPQFNRDVDLILANVNFNPGYQYADFNPRMDKVAAYGVGGLIAGKVLTKVGFFAMLGKYWKLLVLAVISILAALKNKIFAKTAE